MTIVSSQGVINWHQLTFREALHTTTTEDIVLNIGGWKWYLIQDWSRLDKLQMSFRVSMQFTVLFSDSLNAFHLYYMREKIKESSVYW